MVIISFSYDTATHLKGERTLRRDAGLLPAGKSLKHLNRFRVSSGVSLTPRPIQWPDQKKCLETPQTTTSSVARLPLGRPLIPFGQPYKRFRGWSWSWSWSWTPAQLCAVLDYFGDVPKQRSHRLSHGGNAYKHQTQSPAFSGLFRK